MRVTKLELDNYRVYGHALLTPPDGVTVLYGDNAQGKTAILEAIYLCCTGRSHRTARDREMIKWDAEAARISLEVERRDGTRSIDICISSGKRKTISVNSKPIERSGELMGHVTGVLFSPEDLRIVKEGPAERRRFIDMLLSQIRPAYYYNLQCYIRALNQRGALLREAAIRPSLLATISEWNEQLARYGAKIIEIRREFIDVLAAYSTRIHSSLTNGGEKLDIAYQPSLESDKSGDALAEDLLKILDERLETDQKRCMTCVGPHRDDISLSINGADARVYASQGQQRSCALSIKLSEMDVITKATGESPILLLDDVMSELDPGRRRMLLEAFEGAQTIVTCTDLDDLAGSRPNLTRRIASGYLGD
ncbi:MAG: DNA replication/repair protein RecF [Clostridia bacterium]|nr:DNA replication/repair protein RecF [Clostridia bacterium]